MLVIVERARPDLRCVPRKQRSVTSTVRCRAGGPCSEPLAEPPDLAGILHQRQPGANRRSTANGDIGHGSDRKARGRKAQHQTVGVLAHRQMLALAHDVPDVTDHEEIAGDGSGQTRDIVGVAGDEAGCEPFGEVRGGILGLDRIAHAIDEVIGQREVAVTRERNETVGEIGIACGERGLDIVLNQTVVLPEQRIELELGERGRIILGGENRAGLAGMAAKSAGNCLSRVPAINTQSTADTPMLVTPPALIAALAAAIH